MAGEGTQEQRQSCKECVSHREHAAEINNIKTELTDYRVERKEERTDMWNSIKDKVPYKHFLTGLGFVVTAIAVATTINWNSMEKFTESQTAQLNMLLAAQHRVELQVTKVDGNVKNLEKRFDDYKERFVKYDADQEYFKRALMLLMQKHMSATNGENLDPLHPE